MAVTEAWNKLRLKYTTPEVVFHRINIDARSDVLVIGGDGEGAYEWVILKDGKVENHSDVAYGSAISALRDGLMKAWPPMDDGLTPQSAVQASSPKINPDLWPALPGQKALTFLMVPNTEAQEADAAIEVMKRGDTIFLPKPITEMFFHQLRLRVALDPSLADKIAVYYLTENIDNEKVWRAVDLVDSVHWPPGFCMEGWTIEAEISAVRGAADPTRKLSDAAIEVADRVRRKYGC